MFGKEAPPSAARSCLGFWAWRAAFAHWRHQVRLVSVDAATSLEALIYAWLWVRLLRLLGDTKPPEPEAGSRRRADRERL
jgi:hypothetical protein